MKIKFVISFGVFLSGVIYSWGLTAEQYPNYRTVWSSGYGEIVPTNTVQTTPLLVDNEVYSTTLDGKLVVRQTSTGEITRIHQLPLPVARRGMTSFSLMSNTYIAVPHGKGVTIFDDNGNTFKTLNYGITLVPPVVCGTVLVSSTLSGSVFGFNLVSGQEAWRFDAGPRARIWSGLAANTKKEVIAFNTSNPGGISAAGRVGDDNSSSLIVLRCDDGKLVFKYKHILNDVWDFDLVGRPIFINDKIVLGKTQASAVITLSKSGDIIILNLETGQPILPAHNKFEEVSVPEQDGILVSHAQRSVTLPKSLINPWIERKDLYDQTHPKLKYAEFGRWLPPSVNYDLVISGIHGGAEWYGADYNITTNKLLIASNDYPWILRLDYRDKLYTKIHKFLEIVAKIYKRIKRFILVQISILMNWFGHEVIIEEKEPKNIHRWSQNKWVHGEGAHQLADKIYSIIQYPYSDSDYSEKCSRCHRHSGIGDYQSELHGDGYIPALMGYSLTKKYNRDNIITSFSKNSEHPEVDERKINKILDFLELRDKKLFNDDRLEKIGYWQLLNLNDQTPNFDGPFGKLSQIDISTGQYDWSIPVGSKMSRDRKKEILGDMIFGGARYMNGGRAVVTGTTDEKLYIVDTENGNVVQQIKLPAAGSSIPLFEKSNECSDIYVNATGGRFVGYLKNDNKFIKISNCGN